jgi:hypothetical protein
LFNDAVEELDNDLVVFGVLLIDQNLGREYHKSLVKLISKDTLSNISNFLLQRKHQWHGTRSKLPLFITLQRLMKTAQQKRAKSFCIIPSRYRISTSDERAQREG